MRRRRIRSSGGEVYMGMRKPLAWLRGGMLLLLVLFPAVVYARSAPFKDSDHPRLIEPGELKVATGHPSVRVIDLRTSLLDYLKGHVPNAVYLSFETLWVPKNGIPAQTPDRICMEKTLGEYLSVSNDMWVTLYSEKSNPNATYLAWILDYLGHQKVAVLDGGWEKWEAEKLSSTQEYPVLNPKKFFGKVLRETVAEKKWILDHLNNRGVIFVDARNPRQYSGDEGDEMRRGHIPGAKNLFWETTLDGEETRRWKKKDELERLFAESGITKDKEVVVYCRTGREASHIYFTLKHVLGFPKVRLYRGSWVEWSADKSSPIKAGAEP